MSGPRIDTYAWNGGAESMLRFGPEDGPVAVTTLPLFEEANRTRAFAVTLLRALAGHGVAGALPDLPGTGESLVPLNDVTLPRIVEACRGAVDHVREGGRAVFGVTLRSGALLDDRASLDGHWRLAPQDGEDLLRELTRIKQAAIGRERRLGAGWYRDGPPAAPVEIAGTPVSPALLDDLSVRLTSQAAPVRTVRLEGDPRPADRHVPGMPLWRRSEPGNDAALAALLATDIAGWIARCAG